MNADSAEYASNWDAFQRDLKNGKLKDYQGEYVGYHNGLLMAHSKQMDVVIKELEKLKRILTRYL